MCFTGGTSGGSNTTGDPSIIGKILRGEYDKVVPESDDTAKTTKTKEHLSDEKVRRSRMATATDEASAAVSLAGLPLGRTKLGR